MGARQKSAVGIQSGNISGITPILPQTIAVNRNVSTVATPTDPVTPSVDVITDHNLLNKLLWSQANHKMDTTLDMNNNDITGLVDLSLFTFSTTNSEVSTLLFFKSDSDAVGSIVETDDGDDLGVIAFLGVNNVNAYAFGASIAAEQGAASGAFVPTDLFFQTSSDTGLNNDQLVLYRDGNVGINDNTPTFKLDVNGTFRVVSTSQFNNTSTWTNGVIDISYGVDNSASVADPSQAGASPNITGSPALRLHNSNTTVNTWTAIEFNHRNRGVGGGDWYTIQSVFNGNNDVDLRFLNQDATEVLCLNGIADVRVTSGNFSVPSGNIAVTDILGAGVAANYTLSDLQFSTADAWATVDQGTVITIGLKVKNTYSHTSFSSATDPIKAKSASYEVLLKHDSGGANQNYSQVFAQDNLITFNSTQAVGVMVIESFIMNLLQTSALNTHVKATTFSALGAVGLQISFAGEAAGNPTLPLLKAISLGSNSAYWQTATVAAQIWSEPLITSGTAYGFVLNGDGAGSDTVYGAGQDMSILYSGLAGVINTSLIAPSDLNITCGVNKTLILTETVWDDMQIPGLSTERGSAAPDLVAFLGAGGLKELGFDGNNTMEEVHFTVELPHSYKEGTDIHWHVHWSPTTTNAGNVKWQLEYSWANENATHPASTTISVIDASSTTAFDHLETVDTAITGTGKKISSVIVCRLFRDPSDDSDTYPDDATLCQVDFHIEKDTIGSRQQANIK